MNKVILKVFNMTSLKVLGMSGAYAYFVGMASSVSYNESQMTLTASLLMSVLLVAAFALKGFNRYY